MAALLDEAEDIINRAGSGIAAEVELERAKAEGKRSRKWWRFGR
ncbi:MAG: hypothetical protein R2706_01995 [Acidimicrobiales bacterium]